MDFQGSVATQWMAVVTIATIVLKYANMYTVIYEQAYLDLHTSAKCHCHGNKGRPHNILYVSLESAIPKNPLVGPNISSLSAIQADL